MHDYCKILILNKFNARVKVNNKNNFTVYKTLKVHEKLFKFEITKTEDQL